MSNLIKRLENSNWFIVSACKGKATDQQNTDLLKAILAGRENVAALGHWEGQQEQSFLVFTATSAEAASEGVKLAQMFDQTHVLTSSALIDARDGSALSVEGIDWISEAEMRPAFTQIGEIKFAAKIAD